MTVSELIEFLKKKDPNIQIIFRHKGMFVRLSEENLSTKKLYPDLTRTDNSSSGNGEAERYLLITKGNLGSDE
tara:strand:+ start:587 stop:805 length:219 start_codon:yes stop_codon:yes gene_type:complete